ncbi:MAG: N4-gp56 family major capsid protein [Clostridiales bacterium]|jgi:N4-gp56 family major capsid protein|nr:N4-gp56 family major capsid protein [Clostridiales bacterium]
MAQTKLTNLVNPQVMADMISAGLDKAIKFSPLAKIDSTLVGQPGNTITVPKYAYIGDAEVVAEGVAMDTVVLSATTTTATVKKAGKGVEITDEAALSGYGDPVGEAEKQLKISIAAKIDNDCYDALNSATAKYDGKAAIIGYEGVVKAVDVFGEEDYTQKVMFVHPKQITQLRLDPEFRDKNKYPLDVVMTGVIGEIAGCQVIPSKKVKLTDTYYECPIVKVTNAEVDEDVPALTIYKKRDVIVESDRDILKKTTVITADEHYTAHLSNDSKVVVAQFKAEAGA